MNCFVDYTVYSDRARGNTNFARCFASFYDAVPTFEIIGLKGSSFTSCWPHYINPIDVFKSAVFKFFKNGKS